MVEAVKARSLEETPTWAVAVVCFVMIFVSIIIEHIIHLIGRWLTKRHKRALYEALEKIKSGTEPSFVYIFLRAHAIGIHVGKVSLISADGITQLHIFIFVLAAFHVFSCIITLTLSRAKMRKWKKWEIETATSDYQFSHDPERFRFARETSFGRRHLNFWTRSPILLWIVCFFRQFLRSVPKVDYLTLRHGFIIAHLAPHSQTKFDFQTYIKRSLEEDFKVVVGISPTIWFIAVLFLLSNTHGWYSYLWLPFIPLIVSKKFDSVIVLVSTKLQIVITQMGLRIQDTQVVRGAPVVQPGDDLFWFNNPRLLLYLINFVLFQNAFQFAFFAWTGYEFGLKSCFHKYPEDLILKITMWAIVQFFCSYVTLPLYALVTQMGTTMRPTIFNERFAKALRNWHHTAKQHIKQNRQAGTVTPATSAPGTPSHTVSPVHLLRDHRGESDGMQASPRSS
ncbi:hypothetical protein SADUNF_Sadunf16G0078700 [Salix dunnii]|uniref:MLO-like protein n=1 Tax=Salix dunnii TaxID=1413687 RepID=A0A835JD11_9ROSI|nr:hypothetical protein SADUNF_Sadunf16G0078700 [Salix dunnii]